MKSLLQWFLGLGSKGSGSTAADRMRSMVNSDRHQLSPAMIEELKKEVLGVASRYFDIDMDSSDCVIKSQGNRRSYIAATIPLLKQGTENSNDTNTTRKNRKSRKSKKENNSNLQLSST